ncbi:DUF2306 domain-containing protein [Nonomuraea aurantiaca]|uniref:DUF2306 domain-containing protein n=1 Tax=Nonomuraea aurantiaca TaxID=2878562 RepID=UPI0021E62872|nr:DUF2306 domain-containing protein [Nonomuraea aurantiaca]
MLSVAIIVSLVLIYPYLGLDIDNSRLDVRDSLHYYVLVGHIFTAAVALVLGPLQFIPKVRARRRIHRTLGRVYLLAGVLPSAMTTIPVAVWSGRLMTQIGLTTAAVLWLITAGLAHPGCPSARLHQPPELDDAQLRADVPRGHIAPPCSPAAGPDPLRWSRVGIDRRSCDLHDSGRSDPGLDHQSDRGRKHHQEAPFVPPVATSLNAVGVWGPSGEDRG